MTWFAHHIFATATDRMRNALLNEPVFSKGIYWVRDLAGHEWPDARVRHGLSPNGLLVVRPVCDPDLHYASWYEAKGPLISWFEVEEPDDIELDIQPAQVHKDNPEFNITDYPPAPFLKYLKAISARLDATIAYYHCEMWGGDIEIERAWVFMPDEIVYSYIPSDGKSVKLIEYRPGREKREEEGDVLVNTLAHLGLELSTPYFALHERGFPWSNYRIG